MDRPDSELTNHDILTECTRQALSGKNMLTHTFVAQLINLHLNAFLAASGITPCGLMDSEPHGGNSSTNYNYISLSAQ